MLPIPICWPFHPRLTGLGTQPVNGGSWKAPFRCLINEGKFSPGMLGFPLTKLSQGWKVAAVSWNGGGVTKKNLSRRITLVK